jgi:hypothetical protein
MLDGAIPLELLDLVCGQSREHPSTAVKAERSVRGDHITSIGKRFEWVVIQAIRQMTAGENETPLDCRSER